MAKATSTTKAAATKATTSVELQPLDLQTITVRIEGDSSLITHPWSEKAKKQMLDKQMKKATKGREAKDPEADFKASLYHMPNGDGYGFPSIGFKLAAVRAAKLSGMAMTDARAAFHVLGEMTKIEGEPTMREDTVRLQGGTADLRYRAEFLEWSADLTIRYNAAAISAEQVINLVNAAGFGTGIGEWRPEKNGQHGTFHVATEG